MRLLALMILFGPMMFACTSSERGNIEAKQKIRYKEDRKALPEFFKSFFPEEIPAQALGSVNLGILKSPGKGLKWEVLVELAPEQFAEVKSKVEKTALQKGPSNAPYLLINHRFSTAPLFENALSTDTIDFPYPVPCFFTRSEGSHRDRLPDGYQIYVLYAQPRISSQTNWQQGYSWGVATSGKWLSGHAAGAALHEKDGSVLYWAESW